MPNFQLTSAVKSGSIEMVKMLLDAGADPDYVVLRFNSKKPVLEYAFETQNAEIIELMIDKAKLNKFDSASYFANKFVHKIEKGCFIQETPDQVILVLLKAFNGLSNFLDDIEQQQQEALKVAHNIKSLCDLASYEAVSKETVLNFYQEILLETIDLNRFNEIVEMQHYVRTDLAQRLQNPNSLDFVTKVLEIKDNVIEILPTVLKAYATNLKDLEKSSQTQTLGEVAQVNQKLQNFLQQVDKYEKAGQEFPQEIYSLLQQMKCLTEESIEILESHQYESIRQQITSSETTYISNSARQTFMNEGLFARMVIVN